MLTPQALSHRSHYFPLGFPIAERAWRRWNAADLAAEAPGQPGYAYRVLADRINGAPHFHTYPSRPVRAGDMMAFALLTEILRYVVNRYCLEENPGIMLEGLDAIRSADGPSLVNRPLQAFVALYPPPEVYAGQAPGAYLSGTEALVPHEYDAARETLLLHLSMANPAAEAMRPLFDDEELRQTSPYLSLVERIELFFRHCPPVKGLGQALFPLLRAPMEASPDSLQGQLEYVRNHWSPVLPSDLLERIVLVSDVIKEETAMRGHGPGPIQPLRFGRDAGFNIAYPEPEAFTQDRDWMANVVLIAKSVHVWLDQISRQYQRNITRLDQVPDEELDRLARWGFTGLWIIGVWERSPASQRIKQLMGNPEALSSAYSLYDYTIAADLGGAEALDNLRNRAAARGIRLASDMVPNHVGLYSKWVVEHPDWFIQLSYPPFPGYRFNGEDLSRDPRIEIRIEDGYWEHRDAAVVFRRVDKLTGDTRYIYHGNDGTNMPWNDTAQLNFLIPEVREAVIQTILHVARQFPIIRFDAAMTLAKRHYQRLWFPQPGDAGAIPSRAEHGMSRAEFDEAFPKEFWREVVDRIQTDAPDTLLLAEAFWLMEGYFVRTLGMHRVYNSAFMNMLKMEENEKYRLTVKNVLEFSPEVLKRFVNFMNNPDERTAVEQFGRGDKYFGVAVLMVTMPGLPMFGHGQIEGFTEKYGMEYKRAYWNEAVDEGMVARHENEIFPLMRKRRLFSEVEHFAFYDAHTPGGGVDENVFAYSNRAGDERAVVIYNNAYNTTSGTVRASVPFNAGDSDHRDLRTTTLAEALALDTRDDCFYVFSDHRTKLEYIRHAPSLAAHGLSFDLHAYEYKAFLDWREIHDRDGTWRRLEASLSGRGVPSIEEAYGETVLAPIHEPFRRVMNAEMLRVLIAGPTQEHRAQLETALRQFLDAVTAYLGTILDANAVVASVFKELNTLTALKPPKPVDGYLMKPMADAREKNTLEAFWRVPVALAILRPIGHARLAGDYTANAAARMDEWMLAKVAMEAFAQLDGDESAAFHDALLIKILLTHSPVLDFAPNAGGALLVRRMFEDVSVQRFLAINRHRGFLWLRKEPLERLVYWLVFDNIVALRCMRGARKETIMARYQNGQDLLRAAEEAGYRIDRLLELLGREKGGGL
ncbi:MAG TPA: alpha-amylase family glycosyl hydrolase [Candidatus Hydrogenedentes bacterium]|nr:alpha-amylase family glycosyl hydrolase [Candidatus Hydrogenedentota bacterium]